MNELVEAIKQSRDEQRLPEQLEHLKDMKDEELEGYVRRLEEEAHRCQGGRHPMLNKIDAEGGMLIEPSTGFVIKILTPEEKKIFVNVVSHKMVESPHEKELEKEKLDEISLRHIEVCEKQEEEESRRKREVKKKNSQMIAIRVPLSLGNLTETTDRKRYVCRVIDVCVSPQVIENSKKDENYKLDISNFIVSAICQKEKIRIIPNFIKFPRSSYKGPKDEFGRTVVRLTRIKIKKESELQMVTETPKKREVAFDIFFRLTDQDVDGLKFFADLRKQQMKSKLQEVFDPGKEVNYREKMNELFRQSTEFILKFYLRDFIKSAHDFQVSVSDEMLRIEFSTIEFIDPVEIFFPLLLDSAEAQTRYYRRSRVLEVIIKTRQKREIF